MEPDKGPEARPTQMDPTDFWQNKSNEIEDSNRFHNCY